MSGKTAMDCRVARRRVMPLAEPLRPLADARAPAVTVVRAGGLGDTILLLPGLELLRELLPGVQLTLIGSSWAAALTRLIPFPLEALQFDGAGLARLFTEAAPVVPSALSAADAVVIYTADSRSAFVANVARARRAGLVVWPVTPARGRHAAAHFADALTRSALPDDRLPVASLRVPPKAQPWAKAWIAERLRAPVRPIAVHPGSGGRRKCWPPDRFAAMLIAIARPVVLLEGPADAEQVATVAGLLPPGLARWTVREESLERLAGLLTECEAYVGNDSGLSHLAAALGRPTVAIFGVTDPDVWAPRGFRVVVASPPPSDPWPAVDQVVAALTRLLQRMG